MKRKIYRYGILSALLVIMIAGVFSKPMPELSAASHFAVLIVGKAAGLAAGYAAYRLVKRWQAAGLIKPLDNEA